MKKYIKRPITVEAIQWDGSVESAAEVIEFGLGSVMYSADLNKMICQTLEGSMVVGVNDYVIKGINGEFYPCKPDIFEKTYDEVV